MSDTQKCQKCAKPLRAEWYFVIVEGGADAGPYGLRCARLVIASCQKAGLTATRRRVHA